MLRRSILLLSVVLLVLTSPTITVLNIPPSARGGCCMERSNSQWYKNGLSFNRCRNLNNERDRDDLYLRSGTIYWDRNC